MARGLRRRAYALWPSTHRPRIVADVGYPPVAAWLRGTFEADARRRPFLGPATWSAVRARGLVFGAPSRLIRDAVKGAADRDMAGLRLGLYSVAGVSNSKAACFVFEEGAEEPTLVVKADAGRSVCGPAPSRDRRRRDVSRPARAGVGGGGGAAAAPVVRRHGRGGLRGRPTRRSHGGGDRAPHRARRCAHLAPRLPGGDDHDGPTLGRSGHTGGDGPCPVCVAASPPRAGRCRDLARRGPPARAGGRARPAVRRSRRFLARQHRPAATVTCGSTTGSGPSPRARPSSTSGRSSSGSCAAR